MQRVIVIGCPGSGKSTFARALSETVGLPIYHLDMMYWNADRTTVEKSVFRSRLHAVIAEREWIIDGNYGSTMELRLEACDTVFFLDYSLETCLDGVRARRGKPRADMPWIEKEGEEDEEFLEFIRKYGSESRPTVLALLQRYEEKKIVIFRTREEADEYLRALKSGGEKV